MHLANCSSVGALLDYHKGNQSYPKGSQTKYMEGVLGGDVATEKIPCSTPVPFTVPFP